MLIGLIGALDEEIALFLKKIKVEAVQVHAGIRFFKGRLSGKRVVVCKSGVGKVNAALATQILIDFFRVDAIIFSGVAGALSSELNIGDIVISTQTQQYDVDFTAIGLPLGVIPFQETSVFEADPVLIQMAKRVSRGMRIKTFAGKILSGDQFVANEEQAVFLQRFFDGLCVEAEGAATGQACFLNQIPFVVIRAISDYADSSAPTDFSISVKMALRAQALVMAMLKEFSVEK